jgi:hypothetical protein
MSKEKKKKKRNHCSCIFPFLQNSRVTVLAHSFIETSLFSYFLTEKIDEVKNLLGF